MLKKFKKKTNKLEKVKKINKPKQREIVGEFIRVQDVLGFFKYNLNPSYIDAKIEKSIASGLKKGRSVPFQWIMALAVIFIAGAIAYVLISGQTGNQSCLNDLQACYKTCSPMIQTATSNSGVLLT